MSQGARKCLHEIVDKKYAQKMRVLKDHEGHLMVTGGGWGGGVKEYLRRCIKIDNNMNSEQFKDIYKYHLPYHPTLFPFSRNPANYKIVVGDHNRNTNEGTEEEVGAIKIISHPQYNSPRLSSDIALIELAKPVTLSQRVNPICIPSHDSDVPTGSKCYITGGQRWSSI